MKIKQFEKSTIKKLIQIQLVRIQKKTKITIACFFLIVVIIPITIFENESSFYAYQKARVVFTNSFQVISNYLSSFKSSPAYFDISIKDVNLKKLNYIKELSKKHYIGIDSQDPISLMRKKEWVPAKINLEDKTYRVEMRIKGQSFDHWGQYGSYKVKVKDGETILGMKRFALQHPQARGFMNEWYFHKFLKFNGLINLRYDFVSLSINGEHQTVYAIEENFEKRLIENNNRKEGLIVRINNKPHKRVNIQQPDSELKAPYLKEGVKIVSKNINSLYAGKLKVSDVFNIHDLARFYAVIDLWGNRHAGQIKNMRFYFNPTTHLLEPIGYDQQILFPLQHLNILGLNRDLTSEPSEQVNFLDLIFNDFEFYSSYISELNRIAKKELLSEFLIEIENEKQEKLKTLYKSFPYFEYKSKYPSLYWIYQDISHTRYPDSQWLPSDVGTLFDNQEYINSSLRLNEKSSFAILDELDVDERILTLKVYNNELIPLQVRGIIFQKNIFFEMKKNIIIEPKVMGKNKNYKLLSIKVPSEIDLLSNNIKISLSIPGMDENYDFNILEQKEYISENLINKTNIPLDFDFIKVDENNKIIFIEKGRHVIDKSIVFPKGYLIKATEGTSIQLIRGANLISYSPLSFIGNAEDPIVISSDSTGGLVVLNTKVTSNIKYIELKNLNSYLLPGSNISGGLNFYEANVNLQNCLFINTSSEDAINIVRSEFAIDKCIFIDSKSDAIDIDFSRGKLSNLVFKNSGNDGIDISSSIINIENVRIDLSSDKGISIGENSFATIDGFQISEAKIGIAVKDKSTVIIGQKPTYKNLINNTDIGIAVYQKKTEFGPAEVHIGNRADVYTDLIFSNTKKHFVIERKSFLELGNQEFTNFKENVYNQIYN